MALSKKQIAEALARTGKHLASETPVEVLVIGGAAAMLTDWLGPQRTTMDCDLIDTVPAQARQALYLAAAKTAMELGLPDGWLNDRAASLDILPDGWHQRRIHLETFDQLHVYVVGRLDFIAMKCYANRTRDREDVVGLKPTQEELNFAKSYLTMLRVPSRQANLDQVASAIQFVEALGL